MPKIICDIDNCTYNMDRKCTRRNIDVESTKAECKDETFCESFLPRSTMTMNYEFAAFDGKKDGEIDVYCNVVSCVYEKNQKCYADRIHIKKSNVKCKYDAEFAKDFVQNEKDESHVCKDTKCDTYEPSEY